MKSVLAFLLLPQFFLFLRGQGNRQLTQGVVLIDFANQLFQFPSPLLGGGQPLPLLGYVGGLLGCLRFLDGAKL